MNPTPRPGVWWAALVLFVALLFGLTNQGLRELSGRPALWEEVTPPRAASPRAWLRDAVTALRPKELPDWAARGFQSADELTAPVGRVRRAAQQALDDLLNRLTRVGQALRPSGD